ncbi:MAG: hypothetical protein KF833_01060 [Verrucomicrobiae bacterium]|nr:hypothetical protein [Verrucomicrobiae bacterium]
MTSSSSSSPCTAVSGIRGLPLVGSTLVGLAAAGSAQGTVVFTEVTSGGTISSGSSLYFDLGETGGPGAWSNSSFAGADFQFLFDYGNSGKPTILAPTSGRSFQTQSGYAARVEAGAAIGESGSWSTFNYLNYSGSNNANWPAGQRGYIGLRLTDGAETRYGWADVEYTAGMQLTLYGFAVETTPGVAIQAGVIPEVKESALVMALLAGSAALYRRRQRAR